MSEVPRPFLTWAGSKRLIVSRIVKALPRQFSRYFEPFLGAGSLFFVLRPKDATLGDTCEPLIRTYRAVATNPQAVWRYLLPLRPEKEMYYEVRDDRSAGPYKNAAEFIYLNKTCWNGLYRVNSSGKFNVPFGRPRANAAIAHRDNLVACGGLLAQSRVDLAVADFEATLDGAGPGDLVYLDPPYVTGHSNNGFVDYNEVLFSWDDQLRLSRVAEDLRKRGAFVIVSNADHPGVRDLYGEFKIRSFDRKATISGDMKSRGRSLEIIATSH